MTTENLLTVEQALHMHVPLMYIIVTCVIPKSFSLYEFDEVKVLEDRDTAYLWPLYEIPVDKLLDSLFNKFHIWSGSSIISLK